MPATFPWLLRLHRQAGSSDEAKVAEGPPIRNRGFVEGGKMRYLRYLALLSIFMLPAVHSQAAVVVGIGVGPGYGYVGPAPACAYGYYSYYPYACAPYGYYGPQWFAGGVFIGAGPWYHGFYGRGYGYYGRGYGFYGRGGYGYGRGYYGSRAYAYNRGGGFGYGRGYAGRFSWRWRTPLNPRSYLAGHGWQDNLPAVLFCADFETGCRFL
jgi:hypothetical protein